MVIDYEVLTAKEVSEILHVHPSTIYKLTKQGKIPSFRIGADWRFRTDVIERWMAEKSIAAISRKSRRGAYVRDPLTILNGRFSAGNARRNVRQ